MSSLPSKPSILPSSSKKDAIVSTAGALMYVLVFQSTTPITLGAASVVIYRTSPDTLGAANRRCRDTILTSLFWRKVGETVAPIAGDCDGLIIFRKALQL